MLAIVQKEVYVPSHAYPYYELQFFSVLNKTKNKKKNKGDNKWDTKFNKVYTREKRKKQKAKGNDNLKVTESDG